MLEQEVGWPAPYPKQPGASLAKGTFVSLHWGRHQPPLWGCLDLLLLYSRCMSEHTVWPESGLNGPEMGFACGLMCPASTPSPGCPARRNALPLTLFCPPSPIPLPRIPRAPAKLRWHRSGLLGMYFSIAGPTHLLVSALCRKCWCRQKGLHCTLRFFYCHNDTKRSVLSMLLLYIQNVQKF